MMRTTGRLVISEWRKLRSTPTLWWLLLAAVVVGSGTTVLSFTNNTSGDIPPDSVRGLQQGLHTVLLGSTLAEVAGIIGMAGEFRFGQADQSFLSMPRRHRVVTAKILVYAGFGLVFGAVNSAATLVTGWAWLAAKGYTMPFGETVIWQTLGGATASAALFALLGLAIGAALRNQVVGIILVLAVQTVVENSIFAASPTVGRFLPARAGEALRYFPESDLLSAAGGAATLAAWAIVIFVFGYLRTQRSDVT